jgi:hypothetical protein
MEVKPAPYKPDLNAVQTAKMKFLMVVLLVVRLKVNMS